MEEWAESTVVKLDELIVKHNEAQMCNQIFPNVSQVLARGPRTAALTAAAAASIAAEVL